MAYVLQSRLRAYHRQCKGLYMAQKDEDLDLDVAAEKPVKNGKLGKILLFVALGLLGVGLSVTTTLLLLGDDSAAPAAAEQPEAAAAAPAKKAGQIPIYLTLDPAFVVNLNDDSGVRFLQVSVSVMAYSQEALDKVESNMPLLRHHLVLLFSNQKFADVKTREGKVKLQEDALATVRKALTEVTGEPLVEALYLPSIVGQ